MKILLLRTHYDQDYTEGLMLINGKHFGYTLEDRTRLTKKVPGYTSIPAGVYRVIVNKSERFNKQLPLLLMVPGFDGVRIHGGNTAHDSHGCPLVAEHRSPGKIWGSLSAELTKRIARCPGQVWIEIINTLEIK